MPTVESSLIDRVAKENSTPAPPPVLGSPDIQNIHEGYGYTMNQGLGKTGMNIAELSNLANTTPDDISSFNSATSFIPRSELIANKRYPIYRRDVDLEDIYGQQQGWMSQIGNGLAKMVTTGLGTFAESFSNIPNTISAIKNGKFDPLSGDPNGYEGHIDNWMKNMEDIFPNYYTKYEREHPFKSILGSGFSNFIGDKIIKNIGFTVGAIGGAFAQDAIIGAATGIVGDVPMIAGQVGKLSLWLTKLFTGTNDLEKVLKVATTAGKAGEELLSIEKLGQLAAATKLKNGAEYAVNLFGSSMTEAGVEARDGYNQVKNELLNQYKIDHYGDTPTGADQEEIEKYATNAMNTRFGINMALLTVSNAVQFDNLFKSFNQAGKPIKGGLTQELEGLGKIGLKEGSLDVFEKKAATTIPGKVWEFVEPKIPNILSEGVYEEGGQYAAERGTYNYYTRKYKDPKRKENEANWNSLNKFIKSINYGLQEQFGTTEGQENMFIGAISALITGGIMGKIDAIKGRGKEAMLQQSIANLNQFGLTGILTDKYTDTLNSLGNAQEMKQAAKEGNVYKYKNLNHEMFFGFVNSRVTSGRHETTLEQLNMLKDLSKEDFEKSFGMDFNESNKSTVNEYIDGLIKKANSIKETVTTINDTFKNPFSPMASPKTTEEIANMQNYNTFNQWKTDLAFYNTISPEVNSRLESINKSVSDIHPLLSGSLLSSLTKFDSLKELGKSYEEKANNLNKTITDYTSIEDKKRITSQIKSLHTNSERINLALNNSNLDAKTFHNLLNYELNNQDTSKDNLISMSDVPNLIKCGMDTNRLENLKESASNIIDGLASKTGFEKYFDQAQKMREETVEETPTETKTETPQFVNANGEKEDIQVGREYTINKSVKASVEKLADDRYQVTSPDGKVKTFPTEEKANEAAKEINEATHNLGKVTIKAYNADSTIKIEDKNGDIYNIDPKQLTGFSKLESAQEKLQKFADAIANQQNKIEQKSGTVGTNDVTIDKAAIPYEDPRKSYDKLYISTTSSSEDWDNPTVRTHEVRSREFLNNFKNFPNKSNIRLILTTANQEESLGLKGLSELSGSTDVSIKDGLVAAVYVLQENGKTYFVDKEGDKLNEVTEQVDLNKVVFSTMPTSSLYWRNGEPRYRNYEEKQASEQSVAWETKRAELFNAPKGVFTIYNFTISKGIAIENQIDGKNEVNTVGDNLVPENKISTQGGLIAISLTGTLAHNGENYKIPKGRPMLQYGDTFQFLNNKTFTPLQAKTLFEAIKALANDVNDKAEKGKTIEINRKWSDFIQNLLYWRKDTETTKNQIYVDTTNMELFLGGNRYSFTDIAANEDAIINQLKETYHNINNESVKNLTEPFYELYHEDGEFKEREWTNYQIYLLSSTNPDGSSRTSNEVPLTTSVSKPTEAMPYNYKQKYATIQGIELPIQKSSTKLEVKTNEPIKIEDYIIDGKTENSIILKEPLGDVKFIAELNDKGQVVTNVALDNNLKSIATDVTKSAPYINFLKTNNLFDSAKTNEESLMQAVNLLVGAKLESLRPKVEVKQEVKKEEEFEEGKEIPSEVTKPKDFSKTKKPGQSEYRKIGQTASARMSDAELQLFKTWAQKNLPNIPFEVLDNILTTHDGEKAWGVFENGVAKFYKSAIRGTEYHEMFEGIWKAFLSNDDKQALLDEFKSKSGTFIDRQSGKKIKYSDATDAQAKERIADDFADFRLGKIPARSFGEKVLNFFRNIIQFVKEFLGNSSKKTELFNAIDTGEFKDKVVPELVKNEAAEYRAVEGLTEQQTHDFVDDMTARAFQIIFGNNLSLYNIEKLTSSDIFGQIKEQFNEEGKIELLGEKAWKDLIKKTKEFLRTFKVEFDDENQLNINDENINKNDYTPEGFTTDWKKTSPFPIKLLLGTMIETKATNQENSVGFNLPEPKWSDSINGYKLMNFSRTFATVLDKLSNTTKVSDVVNKLTDLVKYDSNYVRLFSRLGGDRKTGIINFDNFNKEDWRLFVNFYQTFTKQKPNALIQYKKGGEVYSAPANLFTVMKEVQNGWIENIKELAKTKDSFIYKDKDKKTYKVSEDIKDVVIGNPQQMVSFLNKLGITFSMEVYNKLKPIQQNKFANTIGGIKAYLTTNNDIASLRGETLGINSQLAALSELFIKVTNPNQDSTYFNVEGKRTNSFSDNNTPSVFENAFTSAQTLDDLLNERPELRDIFSAHSVILKKGGIFFDKDGNKLKALKVSYIQGTNNLDSNKGTSTSKLNKGERFTQELNQNINGNYYILIPADGATEWMMNMGNHITHAEVISGRDINKINTIFRGYLEDDIALALDASNRIHNTAIGKKASELRFLNDILSTKDEKGIETNKFLLGINGLIANKASKEEFTKFINDNITDFNKSVHEYINAYTKETINLLKDNSQILQIEEDRFIYQGLDDVFAKKEKINKNKLSETAVNNLVKFADINYIINNIEYHKILFGDPLQFAIKKDGNKTILDETKRIKSFLSPRRTTFNTVEYNTFLNQNYNKAGDINLKLGDPGYHTFKSYANTVTTQDVNIIGSLTSLVPTYAKTNEADAASIITDATYREVKLKNGQWTDEAEDWHQWQMAYTRLALEKKDIYKYTDDKLKAADSVLTSKPSPKFVLEVMKPIVSGNKFNKGQFDLVLDKFSQMPLYYSMIEGKPNLENLYNKMNKEGIDYTIMISGRKVGSEGVHSLYNSDGSFNNEAFNNNVQVGWNTYGIQVENTYEGAKEQTRGSQLTKVSSTDLYKNGVAISSEVEKEYKHNMHMLDLLHEYGYNNLLNKLGIIDDGTSFTILNKIAVSKTLEYEMLRRELSDNAKDTIQLDENNEFRIPFEASPAYIQIKNILYSMVDKAITSPKMNGGAYVQAPVTLWENNKNRKIALKTDNGYKNITIDEYNKLSDEDKKKVALTDDTLKFYTKENPYCEVMLPAWFKDKINQNKRFKTDANILNYLNKTEEGRKILTGIGFRIPTQSLSSVEVFKVKGFLHESFGNTIIVPSEITTKAGSDFDIDKLNTYLKSIYIDRNGDIKLVEYKGSKEASNDFYSKVFDDKLAGKIFKREDILEALNIIEDGLDDPKGLIDRYGGIIDAMTAELGDISGTEELVEKINNELNKYSDKNLQGALREKFLDEMYKRSLENEYYSSLERLLTTPENFERLISPVDDAGLKDLSQELDVLRGDDESKIKNRILNRNFMTTLRHAFVTGKKWVGIAAVNITGHTQSQKAAITLDPSRFDLISEFDRKILGDSNIILAHNTHNKMISLSGVTDVSGVNISKTLSGAASSIVDVAKDPFFMKIVSSELAIGPFMFLVRVGVPLRQLGMFINQPIIKEYLDHLDSIGSKSLYNKQNLEYIYNKFGASPKMIEEANIDVDIFKGNILTYYEDGKKFNDDRANAEQQLILSEFLKYAKMAEYSFKMTQATNYDTTSFRSGDALYKKQLKTEDALKNNIFTGISEMLDNTFVGQQADFLDSATLALGEILKLDNEDFTAITEQVLKPFALREFMSADDFNIIGNRIKTSFLDFLIQTNTSIDINKLVVDANTSVATQLAQAQKDHPEIKLLKDLVIVGSDREDGAKTIKLNVNDKSAIPENMYTGMMRELRDTPGMKDFYNDLVKMIILQGTYQSAVSMKNIVPIEDYSAIVKPIIDSIQPDDNAKAFVKTNSFQKNNWKDNNIFPIFTPKFFLSSEMPIAEQTDYIGNHLADIYQYFSSAFPNIKTMDLKSSDRKVLLLTERYTSWDLKNDFIKVPRVVVDKEGGRIDVMTGQTITDFDYAVKLKKGDQSLNDVYGYTKVKYDDGTPLTQTVIGKDGKAQTSYVYKMINLLGDGRFASEYYLDNRPSMINNGTIKIDEEIPNQDLINYFTGKSIKIEKEESTKNFKTTPIYENINTTDNLKTFDFGSKEGSPQTDAANKIIHNNIINTPEKSMFDEGESFNEAVARIIPTVSNIIKTAPNNSVVVTHNSVFGLIKLWNDNNRPTEFNKELREAYVKQDNQFPTGSSFKIKTDNGEVIVVRHGETTDNVKKVFRTSLANLTENGVKEATQVGKELSSNPISNMYVSSLPRAIHTANLIMNEQKNTNVFNADNSNLEGADDPNACGQ